MRRKARPSGRLQRPANTASLPHRPKSRRKNAPGRRPMLPSPRIVLGLALVALLPSGARAQDATSTYVVSYFEVAPSVRGSAAVLLRNLENASRKEPGILRFEVARGLHLPNHFVIL